MNFKYLLIFFIYIVGGLGFLLLYVFRKEEFLNKYTPWLLFFFPLEIVSANLSLNTEFIGKYIPNLNIVDLFTLLLLPYYFLIKINKSKTRVIIYFKIFLLINVFSLLFITPSFSLGLQRVIIISEMFIVYSLFKRLPYNDTFLIRIAKIILVAFLFQFAVSSYQLITGDFDPIRKIFYSQMPQVGDSLISSRLISGTFGSGVTFAWTMGFLFFLLLPILFVNEKGLHFKKTYKYSAVIISLALLFSLISATRTSLFLEVFAMFFGIVLIKKRFENIVNLRKVFIAIIIASVIVTPILFVSGSIDKLVGERLSATNLEDSWQFRFMTWFVAVRAIEDHPLLGVGTGIGSNMGAKEGALLEYVNPYEKASYEYAGIHQGHLLIMTEIGIIGYIIYLFLLGSIVSNCFKESKSKDYTIIQRVFILGGALVTIFVFASDFIGATFGLKNSSLLLAALWGISIGIIERKKCILPYSIECK